MQGQRITQLAQSNRRIRGAGPIEWLTVGIDGGVDVNDWVGHLGADLYLVMAQHRNDYGRDRTGKDEPGGGGADAIHTRAIARARPAPSSYEAAIWGMPAVNYDAMYQALVRDAQGASNQIVYWSRLLDWKNQTLTPNPDAIYLMPFYDTTNGTGGPRDPSRRRRLDHWLHRRRLASRPRRRGTRGHRRGQGREVPHSAARPSRPVPDGYLPMPSPTYCGYALLRSNLQSGSDSDIASAVAYGKRVKFYPLADADNAPRPSSSTPPMYCSTPPSPTTRRSSRPSTAGSRPSRG